MSLIFRGNSKQNTLPLSSPADSTHMHPSWCSTIRLHNASPMPVPSKRVRACNRLKNWNRRSICVGLIPMPWSRTFTCHMSPFTTESISTRAGCSGSRNLIALLIKFWNNRVSRRGCQILEAIRHLPSLLSGFQQ